MAYSNAQTLVSTAWLDNHLAGPDVRVLDASWFMPGDGREPKAEYERAHIPGAMFFDIDAIADTHSDLPHMLPSVEKFVSRIRRLGVGDGHRIVVYDQQGLFSAARVWWMFRYFGHNDVAVLDGGLPKWVSEGRATEDVPSGLRDRHFTPRIQQMLRRDITQVSKAVKLNNEQVVDARNAARFRGDTAELREGLRSGHIPGSKNVPFDFLLSPSGVMKSEAELRAVFEASGVDLDKPIITSCGSGVTAAILSLALARLGHRNNALYDGSWSEWGAIPMMPIEVG